MPHVRIVLLLLALGSLFAAAAEGKDSLQEALAASTTPIRSLDPRDAGFEDFEPLVAAIGSARLVLLGEPSHGAGGAFAAKSRLIRFLHQRMGFDVVAWESGLHGLTLAQAALAGDGDLVAAARLGILPVWSAAEEVRPLFEYARSTRGSTRPLQMAGIDMQLSAAGAAERLAADLRAFMAAPGDSVLAGRAGAHMDRLFAAHERLRARPHPSSNATVITPQDLAAVTAAAEGLLALLREERAVLARAHSPLSIGFMEQVIANLLDDAINTYARRRPDRPAGAAQIPLRSEQWNRRDARMAENLRWLLEERHRGRKIVVWAHNAHIVRAYFAANWAAIAHEPVPGGMQPMGVLLGQMFPGDVFVIGFTTYEGDENWTNGQKRGPIAPAPDGSLEARLHQLGLPQAFLDVRAAARRHGARLGPVSLRVSGFGPPTGEYGNDVIPDLGRAFDGVFFVDRMTPATAIPGASP